MAEQDALVCCDDVSSNMNTLLMLDEWILDEPMGHEVEDFNSNTVESWLEATVPDMQTPCVSSSSSSVSHANNNDHRSTTFPELSKIIVKKQVMEKAVERLGGGKKGALMLWGLVQVWLKNRASKSANDSLLQGFLSHESSTAVTNTSTANPNLNPMCTSTFQFAGPEDSVLPQQSADISSSKLHLVNGARILPAVVDGVARNGNASSCLQQQQQQQQTLNSHFPPSIGQRTSSLAMYRQRDLNEDRVRNSAAVTRAARRSRIAQQRKSSNHTNRSRVATSSSISWSSVLAGSGGGGHASCEHRPRHRNSSEKELRVVLEKDLRPSDVGNLGRIVLPKKEAELHLPILTQREGIKVSMEDMTTSNTWKFKYRFWPNNKSRMYVLENTGEFIKSHNLHEGDSIVVYRDYKAAAQQVEEGNYVIFAKKKKQKTMCAESRNEENAHPVHLFPADLEQLPSLELANIEIDIEDILSTAG